MALRIPQKQLKITAKGEFFMAKSLVVFFSISGVTKKIAEDAALQSLPRGLEPFSEEKWQ